MKLPREDFERGFIYMGKEFCICKWKWLKIMQFSLEKKIILLTSVSILKKTKESEAIGSI